MLQNHLIDPTFFFDAIEEFSFNYIIYIANHGEIDEYGRIKNSYTTSTIRGSLQSDGTRRNQSKDGNTDIVSYRFYCKSLYRIDIGDIIAYKGKYLRCMKVQDYDEYGVREAELQMITLMAYRDFADYIKYQTGAKLI